MLPCLAVAIPNAFTPISVYPLDGDWWLEIHCPDYDAFESQPKGLTYEGRTFGRTGWNSDRSVAYYTTRQKLAFAV